jgi:sugar-specific transcriptional regulator TrmB
MLKQVYYTLNDQLSRSWKKNKNPKYNCIIMRVRDEQISILEELGMTATQAKIYLSLAKSKCLTAHSIANIAKIARPDVYRILPMLEDSGLVERVISSPIEFHAIPIDACISILMQKRIMKTAELQKRTSSLVKEFCRKPENEEIDEKFEFLLIPNKAAIYKKAENMIKNAQEQICFLGLQKRMESWLSQYSPHLEIALARNVNIKIIMPWTKKTKPNEALKKMRKYPNFQLKFTLKEPESGFSVWDKKEVLITTSVFDTPFPYPTLWSRNKAIVALSQNYFDLLWQEAREEKREKVISSNMK